VSETEPNGGTPQPIVTDSSDSGQSQQGDAVQSPLKAAPADNDWLQDMESIRNDAPPLHMRVDRRTYRPRTEER
jgi:hypothetical protein